MELKIKHLRKQFKDKNAVDDVLDILTLSDVKGKKIAKLSGGMKRRVGIAQAMLNDPKILVMDEPTAGLDPGERVRFRNFISEFSHDRIVLISTHIVSDIEYIATRNAIMKAGKIIDMGIRPMLKGLTEAFADPKTGIGADLMDIEPDEVEQYFYEKCASHLDDIMNLEQKDYPTARQFATDKYAKLNQPLCIYSGMSRDAFDYIELYILVLSILCIAIAAPVFANEYQTGSDSILRCTKYGRVKLAVTRIMAACSIFIVIFILGMALHLAILNFAFGTDCLKTSFQILFSIISLPNINLGQLQIILVLSGLLSVLATISCTLFLSAKCKDSLSRLNTEDDYIAESEVFRVLDYDIEVKDELISEALKYLPEKKRNVILLSFFLDMTDTEIAKHMNLVRSTIHHHRVSSLQALKKIMEGIRNGEIK